ncbi:hypothetical protein C2G38_2049686 [Gigaspora rosea]|uniref:Uncharacterized protein n=1 Tax=Gigaspora rosea TaxID=44941 RepID=A0A397U2C7_9GLOM|nr:hypothetical protein C2G38_2049686 [Gigaspora rosea]
MKLQSFYIIAIFICINITLAPIIEAHNVYIDLNAPVQCRIWIEDSTTTRIAGDEYYHDCSEYSHDESIDFQNVTYWVHAKVSGSLRKEKVRGPYDGKTCFVIEGEVDNWYFSQSDCK